MNNILIVFACVLLSSCTSSPVEDSVVSVYTTLPTTAGTNPPLDVYHQFATNLAEKITSPIYRFLGFNSSTNVSTGNTSKQSVPTLELLDDHNLTSKHDLKPVDNDIGKTRDVEELSPGLEAPQKKPEKITLYSSLNAVYLPAALVYNESLSEKKLEPISSTTTTQATTTVGVNYTVKNDTDCCTESLEDINFEQPRISGPVSYLIRILGGIFNVIWGGITSLFGS